MTLRLVIVSIYLFSPIRQEEGYQVRESSRAWILCPGGLRQSRKEPHHRDFQFRRRLCVQHRPAQWRLLFIDRRPGPTRRLQRRKKRSPVRCRLFMRGREESQNRSQQSLERDISGHLRTKPIRLLPKLHETSGTFVFTFRHSRRSASQVSLEASCSTRLEKIARSLLGSRKEESSRSTPLSLMTGPSTKALSTTALTVCSKSRGRIGSWLGIPMR